MERSKPPFRVSYLSGCFDPLIRGVNLPNNPELAGALRFLFRLVEHTLQNTPRTWGDPYFNFPDMKAVLYRRSMLADGIRVEYLVHNSEPMVIVRSIAPIKGGPFDPDRA